MNIGRIFIHRTTGDHPGVDRSRADTHVARTRVHVSKQGGNGQRTGRGRLAPTLKALIFSLSVGEPATCRGMAQHGAHTNAAN